MSSHPTSESASTTSACSARAPNRSSRRSASPPAVTSSNSGWMPVLQVVDGDDERHARLESDWRRSRVDDEVDAPACKRRAPRFARDGLSFTCGGVTENARPQRAQSVGADQTGERVRRAPVLRAVEEGRQFARSRRPARPEVRPAPSRSSTSSAIAPRAARLRSASTSERPYWKMPPSERCVEARTPTRSDAAVRSVGRSHGSRLLVAMGRVFVIAEAGMNHDGSVGIAEQLVIAAAEAGADASQVSAA